MKKEKSAKANDKKKVVVELRIVVRGTTPNPDIWESRRQFFDKCAGYIPGTDRPLVCGP